MRVSKDAKMLIIMFLVLFAGILIIGSPKNNIENKVSTSYNADPQGVKAFYSLLEQLDYNTDRLRQPYDKMSQKTKVLLIVEPSERIKPDERKSLKEWIANGGTAIFFSDDLKNVPAAFGSTKKIGKGDVYAFNSRKQITNKGMRDYKNAVRLIELINSCSLKGDLVLFDEYHHGFRVSKPFLSYISRPVRIALLILFITALVMCYAKGRRFGAVRNLPESETLRPGYEFVESVAMLYKKSGKASLAAEILCKSFRQEICRKLGFASDASIRQIELRMESDYNKEITMRVSKLLGACNDSQSQKLEESKLLEMAREIQKLEKELGIGRIKD